MKQLHWFANLQIGQVKRRTGLVITFRRELTVQKHKKEELFRLGRNKRVRVQAVCSGADINRQIRQLKNFKWTVGTPDR